MKHVEPLNGGVVKTRSSDTLAPGELQTCENAIYTPDSEELFRTAGRTTITSSVISATANSVVGGVPCVFNNGISYIANLVDVSAAPIITVQKLTSAGLLDTLNYTSRSLNTSAAGTYLDGASYLNKYYLFDGVNTNTVFPSSGSLRQMGLAPVTSSPAMVTAAGTFSATVTGYYDYWTTEAQEITENGADIVVESTFTGTPTTVLISSLSSYAAISRPILANSSATQWYVYRSAAKTTRDAKIFPVGTLIAKMPITVSFFQDGQSSAYPSTSTYSSFTNAVNSGWTNPNNVLTNNNTRATISGTSFDGTITLNTVFGSDPTTLGIKSPITGIVVFIEAYWNSTAGNNVLEISLSGDGGTTWSQARSVPQSATSTDNAAIYDIGGITDQWGLAWTPAMLSDTNFRVKVRGQNSSAPSKTINVDYVGVRVYYDGTPTIGSTVFPAVIITQGNSVVGAGAYGQPPVASTGDIFQGCLVTNDVRVPSRVRWSLPTYPEYFPEVYRDDLESGDVDQVTKIKNINNRLVVCTTKAKWRFDYLNLQDDASFTTGRSRECITAQNGCINSQCAAPFVDANGRSVLAVAGFNGIFATDGHTDDELTTDFNWRSYFSGVDWSTLKPSLVNNPELWELTFYYNYDATHTYALKLHYHPRHLKNGVPKITGPHDVTNVSSSNRALVRYALCHTLPSGASLVYTGYTGAAAAGHNKLFADAKQVGGGGGDYPGTAYALPNIKTRRIGLAGVANTFTFDDCYVQRPTTSSHTQTITPYTTQFGHAEVAGTAKTLASASNVLWSKVTFALGGEQVAMGIALPSGQDTFNVGAIALGVDDATMGNEDA